jgi:arylsulfatase A-like enzyme
MNKTRPNILWISFEDTFPFYGCYGDSAARTPNLDKLAADGCRWPNAFSTAGVCAPARSAIITCMYAISTGACHMRTTHTNPVMPEIPTPYEAVIPHYAKCLPEYFRAAGYFCTNCTKTDYQFNSPITAWDELDASAHWRNRPEPNQPFFAVWNLDDTHESMMWPENTPEITFDPADMTVPPTLPDTPKVREAIARIYTRIEQNDRRLGELLAQLEEDGLADNTIVFHWSDHGPLSRGKRHPYDDGIHIPMIVRGAPGIEPGTVSDQLVSTIDLGPTILSLAGLDTPFHMQGKAFLGEQAAPERDFVFASRDRHDITYDRVRAARDKRFKYIRNYYPQQSANPWVPYLYHGPIMQEQHRLHLAGELNETQKLIFKTPRPVEELYDTTIDPHETNNLVTHLEFANDLERLRKACTGWMDEVGDFGEIPEAEMVRRWYPNGEQPVTAAPVFVPVCADQWGEFSAKEEIEVSGPASLMIVSATQGASIAYKTDPTSKHWKLYTEPLMLKPGKTEIIAKAIRIGYQESATSSISICTK